jgi:hypothetical protein
LPGRQSGGEGHANPTTITWGEIPRPLIQLFDPYWLSGQSALPRQPIPLRWKRGHFPDCLYHGQSLFVPYHLTQHLWKCPIGSRVRHPANPQPIGNKHVRGMGHEDLNIIHIATCTVVSSLPLPNPREAPCCMKRIWPPLSHKVLSFSSGTSSPTRLYLLGP